MLNKTSIAIKTATAKKNPISPVLVPINATKYIPVNSKIIIAGILYFFSFISGKIKNVEIHNIAPRLLPDSIHPLYPICSYGYVYDDVPVKIAIYIDTIYMPHIIKIANFNFLSLISFLVLSTFLFLHSLFVKE